MIQVILDHFKGNHPLRSLESVQWLVKARSIGAFRANETQRNDGKEQQQLLRIPTVRSLANQLQLGS